MQFENYHKYMMLKRVRSPSKSEVKDGKAIDECPPKDEIEPSVDKVCESSLAFFRMEDQKLLDDLLQKKYPRFCEHLNGFELVDMSFENSHPSLLPPHVSTAFEAWNKQSPFKVDSAETFPQVDLVYNLNKVSEEAKKVEVAVQGIGSETDIQLIIFDDEEENIKVTKKVRFAQEDEIFIVENISKYLKENTEVQERPSNKRKSQKAKVQKAKGRKAKGTIGGKQEKSTNSINDYEDDGGWTLVTSGRNRHNSRRKIIIQHYNSYYYDSDY